MLKLRTVKATKLIKLGFWLGLIGFVCWLMFGTFHYNGADLVPDSTPDLVSAPSDAGKSARNRQADNLQAESQSGGLARSGKVTQVSLVRSVRHSKQSGPRAQARLRIASKVWSDFAAHLPLIRSFSLGNNFPPQYPQFAGPDIKYHYLFYLLVAVLEQLGLNIVWALNLWSVLGMMLLLFMIYQWTQLLTTQGEDFSAVQVKSQSFTPEKNLSAQGEGAHGTQDSQGSQGSKDARGGVWIAGVLSVYLFLFNGSLTVVDFIQQRGPAARAASHWPGQVVFKLLQEWWQLEHFVNFGPWSGDIVSAFWNLNIYTNQRHLGLSFGLVLAIIWPLFSASFPNLFKSNSLKTDLLKKHQSKSNLDLRIWLWVIWLGLILLPILHQAGYVLAAIFIVLWLLLNPRLLKSYGLVYFLGLLYSVPGFVYFLDGGQLTFKPGFLAINGPIESWLQFSWQLLQYWWSNLGLYLPLIPILFLAGGKQERKLLFIFLVYFILANLFRLSPDMINNHKLINFFVLGLNLLTASWLVRCWRQRTAMIRVLLVVLTISLTASGWVDLMPLVNDHHLVLPDYDQQSLGRWVEANTAPSAIFLTTRYLYHPASLAGRKTFLDYGYFAWSLGYADRKRRAELPLIFSEDTTQASWCGLMASQAEGQGIDYVTLAPGVERLGKVKLAKSWLARTQQPVHQTVDGFRVYQVAQICR